MVQGSNWTAEREIGLKVNNSSNHRNQEFYDEIIQLYPLSTFDFASIETDDCQVGLGSVLDQKFFKCVKLLLSCVKKEEMISLRHVGEPELEHKRTIIHFDIDCFYAQVEMIRNPSFRDKPLGIQQKNILVTCNYEARKRGLTKLMYISDARRKCPDLNIVSGEDLTHYRSMSYRISDFIQKYTPLVERLGFDENFADVTDMVDDRITKKQFEPKFVGQIYEFQEDSNHNDDRDGTSVCNCGCLLRTQIGSQIAADVREGLKEELQITCCAGIATNKLLAKLVGSIHKPNQQTTVLPHLGCQLVSSLSGIRSIPGIGSSSSKRLNAIGINSIWDLQQAPLSKLEEEFGKTLAKTFSQLCLGIDNSLVVSFTLPQTISDEDSFKCCNNLEDAKDRIHGLITSLLHRLKDDPRTPSTLRLTVRGKDYIRNSRQCPILASVFKGFSKDNELERISSRLMPLLINLFHKLVDVSKPFNLTLINVCFAKLVDSNSRQNTLDSFFKGHGLKESNENGKSGVHEKVEEEKFIVCNKHSSDENIAHNDTEAKKLSGVYFESQYRLQTPMDDNGNSRKSKNKPNSTGLNASSHVSITSTSYLASKPSMSEGKSFPVSEHSDETKKSYEGNSYDHKTIEISDSELTPAGTITTIVSGSYLENNKASVENLRKLLPKSVDACELLQLPEYIQREILMEYGINTKMCDGQRIFSLAKKISTRSQGLSENSHEEQSVTLTLNQNSEISKPYEEPFFKCNKRRADNEEDFINIDFRKDATIKRLDSSNTVYKKKKLDDNLNSSVQTDFTLQGQSVCVSRQQRNRSTSDLLQSPISDSSSTNVQSLKMPSASIVVRPDGDNPFSLLGINQYSILTQNSDSSIDTIGKSNTAGELNLEQDNNSSATSSLVLVHGEVSIKQSSSSCSSVGNQKRLVQNKISSDKEAAIASVLDEKKFSSKVKKCPEGVDPDVFYSLPPNIQGEILAHNAMGTASLFTKSELQVWSREDGSHGSNSKASKSNRKGVSGQKDIFDYFKRK